MVSIGGIQIERPLALAPMAGVTDAAFRAVCREQGAALTCTEMVSAKALCYQDKKTLPLLKLGEEEHPAAVQIFGSDPVCMGSQAVDIGHADQRKILLALFGRTDHAGHRVADGRAHLEADDNCVGSCCQHNIAF